MGPRLVAAAVAVALLGCGGRERREGGPSDAGPASAGATGRTRPGGAAPPAEAPAAAAPADAEAVPEPPAGSVTSFDVEVAAAKLAADVRSKRAALGDGALVGDPRISNRSGSTNVDMELVQALVLRALLAEQVGVQAWRSLEAPVDESLEALQRQRRSTVHLVGEIARERRKGEGTEYTTTYDLRLVSKTDRTTRAAGLTTVVRTHDDDDGERPSRPPEQAGAVDLSRAVAACVQGVLAAKPAGVRVCPSDNRTRRRLDDLAPQLATRLSAAGVRAEAEAPERELADDEAAEDSEAVETEVDGYEDDTGAATPTGPRATHALVTRLFEESWTSDDGDRYRSVIAVFVLVDVGAAEVTRIDVVRVRG